MTTQEILGQGAKRLRVLWAILTFVYFAIAGVMAAVSHAEARPAPSVILGFFVVSGGALGIGSFVMPARFYAARVRRIRADIAVAGAGPTAFLDPAKAARQAIQAFASSFLVGVALACSLSWFGAFLHLMGGPTPLCAAFFVAAFVLAAFRFPSVPRIAGPFERHFGASFAASEGGS
jgi:hypothetical protein